MPSGIGVADEVNAFTLPTADHPLKVKVVIVAMFESERIPEMFRASSSFGWSGANWITSYHCPPPITMCA
jgi:hypothetical protein